MVLLPLPLVRAWGCGWGVQQVRCLFGRVGERRRAWGEEGDGESKMKTMEEIRARLNSSVSVETSHVQANLNNKLLKQKALSFSIRTIPCLTLKW